MSAIKKEVNTLQNHSYLACPKNEMQKNSEHGMILWVIRLSGPLLDGILVRVFMRENKIE
jgi:hypothetical protein